MFHKQSSTIELRVLVRLIFLARNNLWSGIVVVSLHSTLKLPLSVCSECEFRLRLNQKSVAPFCNKILWMIVILIYLNCGWKVLNTGKTITVFCTSCAVVKRRPGKKNQVLTGSKSMAWAIPRRAVTWFCLSSKSLSVLLCPAKAFIKGYYRHKHLILFYDLKILEKWAKFQVRLPQVQILLLQP